MLLSHFVSEKYVKNCLQDEIQIWPVGVASHRYVPYLTFFIVGNSSKWLHIFKLNLVCGCNWSPGVAYFKVTLNS